jgi:hypothetical protein
MRYRARIAATQVYAPVRCGVRLTFRPLGKNLRLLGTAIRGHVDAGRGTFIAPDGPPTEMAMLAAQGRAWAPWLWSRTGDAAADAAIAADAAQAWRVLFDAPGEGDVAPAAANASIRPLPSSGAFDAARLERVLRLAVATRYAFRPNARVEAAAAEQRRVIGWPAPDVPVLGIHVRRSDAASSEASGPLRSNRASFPLTVYLDAADRLCQTYGIRHLFVASESELEVARARELRPQYTVLSLPHDRTLFPDISESPRFIEHLALAHPERARALAMAAIFDLRTFCECAAFVGAFNSEFSMLAWLLAVGSRGSVVPYESLSEPVRGVAWHPHDALLNVRNNCPLELYHW